MLVVETWDSHNINDETNYKAGFNPAEIWGLPSVEVQSVDRAGAWPVFGTLQRPAVTFSIFIAIKGASVRTLRAQLLRWFDPEDETPKKLVITDDGTLRSRYVYAICSNLKPISIGDLGARDFFRVDLVINQDVRWRGSSDVSDTWNITASGQTKVINNTGEDDAYPVYKIKPTAAKTGGYAYRRWVAIPWRSVNSGTHYPIRLVLATDAIVAAGHMQADGDDLRILSDGLEEQRWLNDIDTASTDIWFSLDFTQAPVLKLKTAIAAVGAISSIEFTDEVEVSLLPESGIIYIDTEAFTYTARNLIDASVTGITREAKGTTIGAHLAAATCHWIQHDVYIIYGNATATAPTQTATLKPTMDLDTSTNDSWVFSTFGLINSNASGSNVIWEPSQIVTIAGFQGCYNGTEFSLVPSTSPGTVVGCWRGYGGAFSISYQLYNPCGITNVDWADGKMYAQVLAEFWGRLSYWVRDTGWWTSQQLRYVGAGGPTIVSTWQAWSTAAGVAWNPANHIMIALYKASGGTSQTIFEAGTVTVTLNNAETPVVAVGAEQGNYELSCVLGNTTTGDSISLEFVMDLDSELEIDTYNRVITWLKDATKQYQAISFSTARKQWLRLQPGNNTLSFVDVGTDTLTVTTTFTPRYY